MTFELSEALRGVREMGNAFVARLPYIILAVAVFLAFYFIGKAVRSVARRVSTRRKRHQSVGMVLGRLAQGGIVFLGIMIPLVIALPTFKPAQLMRFFAGSVSP